MESSESLGNGLGYSSTQTHQLHSTADSVEEKYVLEIGFQNYWNRSRVLMQSITVMVLRFGRKTKL